MRAKGDGLNWALENAVNLARAGSVGEDGMYEVFGSGQQGSGVACIAVDPASERWLLAADSRAGVRLFDCERKLLNSLGNQPVATNAKPSTSSAPAAAGGGAGCAGHTRGVSVVAWWPVDSGLFVSGGYDGRVVAWDAASFTPVHTFDVGVGGGGSSGAPSGGTSSRASASAAGLDGGGKVYSLACSPVASRHALVAVATDAPGVRLVDLSTGAAAQTLIGHRAAVMSVAWHSGHEYILASGSRDGTLRLWDVRRSGATAQLAVLDQHMSGPANHRSSSSAGGSGAAAGNVKAGSGVLSTIAAASYGTAGNKTNPSPAFASAPSVAHGDGGVNGLCFPSTDSVAGASLLSTGLDSKMRRWRIAMVDERQQRQGGTPSSSASSASSAGASNDDDNEDTANLVTGRRVTAGGWNSLIAYPHIHNRHQRSVFIATAQSGRGGSGYAFHPNSSSSGGASSSASSLAGPLAGGAGGSISIHDIDTGEPIAELRGHHAGVNAVVYRSSHQELFSCSDDGMIFRWRPKLLRWGRSREAACDPDPLPLPLTRPRGPVPGSSASAAAVPPNGRSAAVARPAASARAGTAAAPGHGHGARGGGDVVDLTMEPD